MHAVVNIREPTFAIIASVQATTIHTDLNGLLGVPFSVFDVLGETPLEGVMVCASSRGESKHWERNSV